MVRNIQKHKELLSVWNIGPDLGSNLQFAGGDISPWNFQELWLVEGYPIFHNFGWPQGSALGPGPEKVGLNCSPRKCFLRILKIYVCVYKGLIRWEIAKIIIGRPPCPGMMQYKILWDRTQIIGFSRERAQSIGFFRDWAHALRPGPEECRTVVANSKTKFGSTKIFWDQSRQRIHRDTKGYKDYAGIH